MRNRIGWFFRSLFILALGGTVLSGLGGGLVLWHFSRDLPKIITVEDYRPLTVTRIIEGPTPDSKQEPKVVAEFYKERRYLIPFEKIPAISINAFIAAEDDRFFEHQGVNLASIIRAMIANFRAGHVVQGGSTITMQVTKSLLLTPERSFSRKFKEVILASGLERNLTKQQILYLYLNQIYLGHGAHGIQSAAKIYFRKDVSELNLGESALLAGLPQAPSKYSPLINPKRAKERQLYVLRRMFENKFITQDQLTQATAEPIKLYHDEELNNKYAPHLVEHIRRYLLEKYGEKAVYEEGMTVTLPAPVALTQAATKSLQQGLHAIDQRQGYRGPIKRLKNPSEIEAFLRDERIKLILRKIQYEMLMPDGRLDAIAAMKSAGMATDLELLDIGELYEAVVTNVDDKKKAVRLMIGASRAEMSFDTMKWARLAKAGQPPGPEPTAPSRVVSAGSVVLVRVLTKNPETVSVALEQKPQVQGALLSMEVKTGIVLAMIGGYDFEESEFNRAIQAQRQPGSAFKPILYAAGLEYGFTPASVIVDSPLIFEDDVSGKWKPSNYEEKFYGDTTFRQALIKSRNVPTIKILQAIQIPTLIEYAKRLGMNSQFPPDMSISLGSATSSLMEISQVYALFPRLGRRIKPIYFSKIMDRDGNLKEESKFDPLPKDPVFAPMPQVDAQASPSPEMSPMAQNKSLIPPYPPSNDPDQVMDPRVAYVMTHLMTEVVNYGTGYEAKSLGRAVAGKTGTTSDYIDAWFMGYTPSVVTGVWVGFDNLRTLGHGETGNRSALPIWLNYMKEAVKAYPPDEFPVPQGVTFATIDPANGKLVPEKAPNAIKEAFISGTEPTDTASSSTTGGPASQSEFLREDVE